MNNETFTQQSVWQPGAQAKPIIERSHWIGLALNMLALKPQGELADALQGLPLYAVIIEDELHADADFAVALRLQMHDVAPHDKRQIERRQVECAVVQRQQLLIVISAMCGGLGAGPAPGPRAGARVLNCPNGDSDTRQ